ncbi:MAG: hypothetical protein R2726_20655 [Acidimicrobiales bacterium]
MRGPTSTRAGVVAVLVALVLALLTAVTGLAAAQTPTTPTTAAAAGDDVGTLRPGELVVTQQRLGQLLVITAAGTTRSLSGSLESPRGVAVLPDLSVLVAENTANRISGIEGPFGSRPAPVASFPSPEAIAVAADGAVYVSSLNGGQIARLDVATRTITPVADGFVRPTGLAAQGGAVYVADASEGSITRVGQDGAKEVVAQNLGAPTGLAIGPDRTMYVADFVGKRVLKVDPAGQATELARVDDPVQIALVPADPKPNEPFVLAVTMADGVIQLDQSGQPVGRKTTFPRSQAVGLATVPGGPPVAPSTTVAGGASASSTTAPATATTVVRPAGADDGAGGTSAAAVLAGVLAVIVVVGGLAIGVLVLSRRGRSGFEAGFSDLDSDLSMSEAMGPCAAEEVELAESESALTQVLDQRESALRRKREATERVTRAAARREEARTALEKVEAATPAVERGEPFVLTDLRLSTDEGRAALRAFGQQEMTGDQLRRRWDQLSEHRAVEIVAGVPGEGAAPAAGGEPTWSDARVAVLRDLETESELAQAARDVADADLDLERLATREEQARERIATAKEALEACRERTRQAAAAAARQEEARRRGRAGRGGAPGRAGPGAGRRGRRCPHRRGHRARRGEGRAGEAEASPAAPGAKDGAGRGDGGRRTRRRTRRRRVRRTRQRTRKDEAKDAAKAGAKDAADQAKDAAKDEEDGAKGDAPPPPPPPPPPAPTSGAGDAETDVVKAGLLARLRRADARSGGAGRAEGGAGAAGAGSNVAATGDDEPPGEQRGEATADDEPAGERTDGAPADEQRAR